MLETKSRKLTGIIATVAISLVVFANISAASASEITSEKMIELTNQSRIDAGLKALNVDSKLVLAAQRKADDMFKNQYFDHISPAGTTPWDWFNSVGYDYTYAAENLAIDFNTAEGAHSALMKSTGHRENILGANYEDIGIAAVSVTFDGRESVIIVEEFGALKDKQQDEGSDAFYETPVRENKQNDYITEIPKSNIIPKATVKQCEGGDCQEQKAPEQPEKSSAYAKKDDKATPAEENNAPSYGKIIPEIYSIMDQRSLKKVYAENIYWKNADKDDYTSFLNSSKARLKSLLKSWTNGNCCNGAGK
jgi:uncharacterized protein YkwD